jgi:tetrahydromethanopterin S-methyltransferase subunit E
MKIIVTNLILSFAIGFLVFLSIWKGILFMIGWTAMLAVIRLINTDGKWIQNDFD